eukprot:2156176-Rhodomonas_salina.1
MREAAAASSAAAAELTLPQETVTILDDEAGAAADNKVGHNTADEDATEEKASIEMLPKGSGLKESAVHRAEACTMP